MGTLRGSAEEWDKVAKVGKKKKKKLCLFGVSSEDNLYCTIQYNSYNRATYLKVKTTTQSISICSR